MRLVNIFKVLPGDLASRLGEERFSRHFRKGQILFYEGQDPTGVYCIFQGHIKVYQSSPTGQEHLLYLSGPGNVVGFSAILSGQKFSATAEAMDDVVACFIERRHLERAIAEIPSLSREILRTLAQEIQDLRRQTGDLALRSATQRFAGVLVMLNESVGRDDNGERVVDLELTRKELADMIGTTQETLIRILSQMRDSGLVQVDRSRLILKDIARLKRIYEEGYSRSANG
ncbi:MAG: Crp/Fnr family transcriptional regulator [bacterium JZ-2024 1]